MELKINTVKKTIEVPHEFKVGLDNSIKFNKGLGQDFGIEDVVKLSEYKIIVRPESRKLDRLNRKQISDFMESKKETHKEEYKRYMELVNANNGINKNGKPIATNFFTLKKLVYQMFPELKSNN
jgi:hypothetical protein